MVVVVVAVVSSSSSNSRVLVFHLFKHCASLWGWCFCVAVVLVVLLQVSRGWAGVQSLPRQVFVDSNNMLRLLPVPELSKLRSRNPVNFSNLKVVNQVQFLTGVSGDQLEILAHIVPSSVTASKQEQQ